MHAVTAYHRCIAASMLVGLDSDQPATTAVPTRFPVWPSARSRCATNLQIARPRFGRFVRLGGHLHTDLAAITNRVLRTYLPAALNAHRRVPLRELHRVPRSEERRVGGECMSRWVVRLQTNTTYSHD